MTLGMEVGLGSVHIVLDGDTAPLPQKGARAHQFSAHVYCGQTAAWIKMPLGTEVGLGLRDIVFNVDPATQLPPEKGHIQTPTQFLSHVCCGWMDEDAAWYGSRPRPRQATLN